MKTAELGLEKKKVMGCIPKAPKKSHIRTLFNNTTQR